MYINDILTETFVEFYYRDLNTPSVSDTPYTRNYSILYFGGATCIGCNDLLEIPNTDAAYFDMETINSTNKF